MPPRSSTVSSGTSEIAPTLRDQHSGAIAEQGRGCGQTASGYHWRAFVKADICRWKRVIGDGLRSRTEWRQATEVAIASGVLNRILEPRTRRACPHHTIPIICRAHCIHTADPCKR
jgi:hypothetical protein